MQEIDNYLRLGSNIIEYKNEYDDTILHEVQCLNHFFLLQKCKLIYVHLF